MKILCVADNKDPIVYSSQIKSRFSDVDMVLGAGDLELEFYGFIVSSLNKPLLFVFGNHHLTRLPNYRKSLRSPYERLEGGIMAPSFGSTYVGGKVKIVGGVIVAGLGGSRKYNDGMNQFTEFGMFRMIVRLLPSLLWNRIFHGRYLDVLLTHTPPWGVGDKPDPCHRGFRIFRWFVRKFKPRYLVHGHIHLYDLNAQRSSVVGETTVINAYNHVVIDVDPEPRKQHASSETQGALSE